MKTQEIFEYGYAIPLYDISHDRQTFRFRDEEFRVPVGAVKMIEHEAIPFRVARIEDIRNVCSQVG